MIKLKISVKKINKSRMAVIFAAPFLLVLALFIYNQINHVYLARAIVPMNTESMVLLKTIPFHYEEVCGEDDLSINKRAFVAKMKPYGNVGFIEISAGSQSAAKLQLEKIFECQAAVLDRYRRASQWKKYYFKYTTDVLGKMSIKQDKDNAHTLVKLYAILKDLDADLVADDVYKSISEYTPVFEVGEVSADRRWYLVSYLLGFVVLYITFMTSFRLESCESPKIDGQ